MPDQLKPIFAAMKPQLKPDDALVTKTLTAIEAESTPASAPTKLQAAPGRRHFPRWASTLAAFTVGVAMTAMAFYAAPAIRGGALSGGAPVMAPVATAAAAPAPDNTYVLTGTSEQTKPGASSTNVQVAGIDEGDVVKTDGRYIYVAHGRQVAVIVASGAWSHQVATIDTSNLATAGDLATGPVVDMMIDGTTLIVLAHAFNAATSNWVRSNSQYMQLVATGLKAGFYDISDPTNPVLLSAVTQQGTYVTSRLSNDTLYLISRYDTGTSADTSHAPVMGQEATVVAMPGVTPTVNTVVSAINTKARDVASQITVRGDAGTVYMSQNNLYLASQTWFDAGDVPRTAIMRLALAGGTLRLAATGQVDGVLLDQFSLDESDGYLRVVLNVNTLVNNTWTFVASLSILDASLQVVGCVPQLVTDETVQSVRFDGSVAYVVTFRQRDPLFTIDLSDPRHPIVQSALKIPGFSTYLHPFGDGLLLGVGFDTDDQGMMTGNLKLTMFDVSDPFNVQELATLRFRADDSEAASDHHAVFVDEARGLIGVPSYTWGYTLTWEYDLFAWDGTSFTEKAVIPLDTGDQYPGDGIFARGVRVYDDFYIATSGGVTVVDLAGYHQLAQLRYSS